MANRHPRLLSSSHRWCWRFGSIDDLTAILARLAGSTRHVLCVEWVRASIREARARADRHLTTLQAAPVHVALAALGRVEASYADVHGIVPKDNSLASSQLFNSAWALSRYVDQDNSLSMAAHQACQSVGLTLRAVCELGAHDYALASVNLCARTVVALRSFLAPNSEGGEWLHATFIHALGPAIDFNPQWRTSDTVAIARGILADRALDRLPILADALQDAGFDNLGVIRHLQDDSDTWTLADWTLYNLVDFSELLAIARPPKRPKRRKRYKT